MSPSFSGRPVFVDHVDGVDENINELRKEADGWVVESFYNASDGKTWAKFIIVSDRGMEAIRRGYRLSNAYIPKSFGHSGLWNGVEYQKEVLDGEFEHLAIVQNPRYEESVIMTPEQFKEYNERKTIELKSVANSKGDNQMKFWKKAKIENSIDLESTMVEMPKSKKELSLATIVNEYDAVLNMQGYASDDHMVKVGNEEMSVKDLVKAHQAKCNEMDEMKKMNADGKDLDEDKKENEGLDIDQMGDVGDRGGDKSLDNEEDEEEEKKKKENAEKEAVKKNSAKAKALALKNANLKNRDEEVVSVDLSDRQVARGKDRYGSGN